MFATLHCGDADRRVQRIGQADGDDVNVLLFEQLTVVAVRVRDVVLVATVLRALQIAVADGSDLDARRAQSRNMPFLPDCPAPMMPARELFDLP